MFRCCLFTISCGLLLSPVALSADKQAGIRYFETHIRPLFAEHCYKCHGEKKQEGGLRLDTFKRLMAGGDSGASLVPGKPNQSLLATAVQFDDTSLQMPPDKKLPKTEIAKILHWIKLGAPHPDGDASTLTGRKRIDLAAGRRFWAFKPLVLPGLPDVSDVDWTRSPVDFFVLRKLNEVGLKPAGPANRRTLIRRATLDLIGIPPTPEQVTAYVNDQSPDAFARLVDRLLDSPLYGERWGRHWLDVVRYADSNGLDENVHHGNAWRFRDYVVNSLNSDKPFDDFLREQIAGDMLDSPDVSVRNERLIATGFHTFGPKVLAEPDARKMEMDIIDEQIDTLGRAFMGLTLGCARCHDHKFDPISANDYYALAGIFKSTKTMENYRKPGKTGRWWENAIPTATDRIKLKEHEQQVADARTKIDNIVEQAKEQLLKTTPELKGLKPAELEAKFDASTKQELKTKRDALAKLQKAVPSQPFAMGVLEQKSADVAVHIRGSYLTLGDVIPRRFPIVLANTQEPISKDRSGRLKLANWLTKPNHPLTARVFVNRVWRWHFGQGIVETPDNFGNLGGRPTNQPLLDWLAVHFVERGWSIKQLHRTIMLTSTYQMSSSKSEPVSEIDPTNKFHSHANLRRLEVEAIRDSILAVSGQLDQKMSGTLLTLANRGYFFDHTSKDTTSYDTNRRSIYLPVVRNHLYEVFSLFDYADAGSVVGSRGTSTVAPQALFALNSEFMHNASVKLSQRVTAADLKLSETDRINRLFTLVLSREPSGQDLLSVREFLANARQQNSDAPNEAWRLLAHALLSSNEFVYAH
jgi:hypothetical protein